MPKLFVDGEPVRPVITTLVWFEIPTGLPHPDQTSTFLLPPQVVEYIEGLEAEINEFKNKLDDAYTSDF